MTNLNRIFFSTVAAMLLANIALAQSFTGYNTSNYAGIYGVISNPATAAGYRYKWDLNIMGADINAGNTYISVPKSVLFNMPDTLRLNRDYFLDQGANRKQNGWEMAEIVLPSVLYSIDDKQSVSFLWRMRSSSNGGNVSTPIANFFGVNFPNPSFTGTSLTIPQTGVSSHIWHELGFSYARVIKQGFTSRLKGGITLKLLSGVAAGYATVKDVNFALNNSRDAAITSGTLYYGYNTELDHWQKSPINNLQLFQNNGIGADIGFIYEYRPDNGGFGTYESSDADEYKFRIGISVNDIGRIKYQKGANNATLQLTKDHVVPSDITYRKNESLQQYARRLNNYFTPVPSDTTFNMTLPASLNLMGDYNIDDRFFIGVNAIVALNAGKRDITKTHALTQLNITPRYETSLFGAYLPLTINHNGQADIGGAVRIGPLIIGAASLFTNLFERRIDHGAAFVALRLNSNMFDRGDSNGGGIFKMRKRQLGCPVNNY
ncbi:hypothetical protein DVR12_01370 [Chitinophaga silvatica]|uniref:DUF5723 domain-containing protein n=1 Tax=Chitinophaga silvatica TaxID=2282649 RepID=A0A3E1YGG4_9BACT|nr:DUF5723 family protein [Chitinophaga silvatica]RFS26466.1 hypothetical protein DVR12_01370 [Chitinophaga silvatica]